MRLPPIPIGTGKKATAEKRDVFVASCQAWSTGDVPEIAKKFDRQKGAEAAVESHRRRLGRRPIDRFCDGFQAGKRRPNVFVGRDGALERTNHLRNRHHWRIWIAGGSTEFQQEAAVPRDAVTNLAKAGEIDKKPFLEERRASPHGTLA